MIKLKIIQSLWIIILDNILKKYKKTPIILKTSPCYGEYILKKIQRNDIMKWKVNEEGDTYH